MSAVHCATYPLQAWYVNKWLAECPVGGRDGAGASTAARIWVLLPCTLSENKVNWEEMGNLD